MNPNSPFALTVLIGVIFLITGCSQMLKDPDPQDVIPVGTVKPDLDFSSESPDCETAALRISDNVEVGMTLADVRRLVGQPRVVLPGSWWWTAGFSLGGRPNVRYAFGPGEDDVPVTSFSVETSGC